jgi:hypothetical protein
MAKVHLLDPFEDLALIGRYAASFGMDPDAVFTDVSFHTIINFIHMWKEQDEYQERFRYIWSEINRQPDK